MTPFQRYIRITLPIILAIVLIAGIFIGKIIDPRPNQNMFIHPQPNKLNSVISLISNEYVDSINVNELIEKVIPELVSNLDPHSVYIPAKDHKRVNEPLIGNFEGIGVQFKIQEDTIAIVKAIINGPSYNVGIKDGDRIIKINDTVVAGVGINESEVMNKLRGKKGTTVDVSIHRRSTPELLEFTITRDKIPLFSVDVSFMVDDSIGYIKISKFAQTTYKEFIQAVKKLKANGFSKHIIDLRGNSGGYLDAATNIADEYLSAGKMIVYTEGKARPKTSVISTDIGLCENDEIVILMDEWSASASEILAGAIQDNDRGIIIGRRSFGKGLVQEQTRFRDGSSLRLTTARYYTPTGRSIQKSYENGIEDYQNDLGFRYYHGEFQEKDSIEFNDSLKYITPNGKIVYGGGGIMPDIFIPIDTIGTSGYYTRITRRGLLYHFAFDYADKHRKELSKMKNWSEIYNYLVQKNVLVEFVNYASEKGIEKNQKDINISRKLLETRLYALITRNILDNVGFYPILLKMDNTFNKAYSVLK